MRRCRRCKIRRAPDEFWPGATVCEPCLDAWRARVASGLEIAHRWKAEIPHRPEPATPATRRL